MQPGSGWDQGGWLLTMAGTCLSKAGNTTGDEVGRGSDLLLVSSFGHCERMFMWLLVGLCVLFETVE